MALPLGCASDRYGSHIMKKYLVICLLLPASVLMLFSKSLKIADSIVYKIPDGWSHSDSKKQLIADLGTLTSVILENPAEKQTLTVSVLSVDEPVSGVQYSTRLIEATLSPWVEAYRKKGSHYYPRKILGRENLVYYSQEVGLLNSKKVELRGMLIKKGDDWVNFFCIGPDEISWEQYRQLINGTRLLNVAAN